MAVKVISPRFRWPANAPKENKLVELIDVTIFDGSQALFDLLASRSKEVFLTNITAEKVFIAPRTRFLYILKGKMLDIVIPTNVEMNLEELYISDVPLTRLPRNLINLKRLIHLDLVNLMLKTLDMTSFSGMMISTLDIEKMGSVITSSRFSKLDNLTELTIENSRLGVNFDRLIAPALNTIDLGHNKLRSIPSSLTKINKNIGNVFITDNDLQTLPLDVFIGFNSLVQLFAFSNSISKIVVDKLKSLPELSVLDLENNRLTEIDALSKVALPNLYTLSLKGNRIKSLKPVAQWATLQFVYLQENPIECRWVRATDLVNSDWSRKPHIQIDRDMCGEVR
ncbi:leucine-rich repeat-containing protein 7-like [Uranotaenia lowii]|uniref:leucine-rich repeat-containing protein 7-like n=1 Tax=Uranotaenia lowii TaxID=190385 RepID=UPI002478C970|nr:leucine-rich repeat-containing protein 7-like [Uranotaenia lowii]